MKDEFTLFGQQDEIHLSKLSLEVQQQIKNEGQWRVPSSFYIQESYYKRTTTITDTSYPFFGDYTNN